MTPDDKDAVLDLARANLARADLTPDELSADMEAVERRIQQDMDDFNDVWRHCRIAFVDAADPDDVVGFPSFTKTDIRALLKAYQEQRRVLEEANARIGVMTGRGERCPQCADTKRDCANAIAAMAVDFNRARAALNQKGDER
jgi:hypothetical protein